MPSCDTPAVMNEVTARDHEFMQMALEEARLAISRDEVPIGAVLVHENRPIARAHNFRETWNDPTAHAEIIAIRRAASLLGTWRLTGASLYVTVEPCAMCAGAIVLARIARLVFGAWDPKGGACGSIFNIPNERRLNHRVIVVGGVFERESQNLLQAFFRRRRRPTGVSIGVSC